MTIQQLQTLVMDWYTPNGRHTLPWRLTSDPYAILVSELMLQQTQVERVIPKYLAFIKQFPTVASLSRAKLADVLIAWQGLGYNRRAKYLWQTATQITKGGGVFPTAIDELQSLPGIGLYTAAAVACFSFNQVVILIETNIRTVFLYHFFPEQTDVSDTDLVPLIKASLDIENPREWYWALMDYGSYLKKVFPNPSRRSRQYNKQSAFAGSMRQTRGEIVRLLSKSHRVTLAELTMQLQSNPANLPYALNALKRESMICEKSGYYQLAKDLK